MSTFPKHHQRRILRNLKMNVNGKIIFDVGVHWRRGDFINACLNKKDPNCYPTIQEFITTIPTDTKDIWIATNEPSDIPIFQSYLPSTNLHCSNNSCTSKYFHDLTMLTNANKFIGNTRSTLSRLVYMLRN